MNRLRFDIAGFEVRLAESQLRRVRVLPFFLLVLLPVVQAGTPTEPELSDGVDDVVYSYAPILPAVEPWDAAVDLTAFWITADDANAYFHYQFRDFSNLSMGNLYSYSGRGIALFAHTFLSVDNKTKEPTVFFEYGQTLGAQPEWTFRFGETALNGSADEEAATVEVQIPFGVIGANPGSRIEGIYLYAASTPSFPVYAIDYLPDAYEPCDCGFQIPAAPKADEPLPMESPLRRDAPGPHMIGLALAVAVAGMVRRSR